MKLVKTPSEPASTVPGTVKIGMPFDFENRTIEIDGEELNFVNSTYSSGSAEMSHTANVSHQTLNVVSAKGAAIVTDNPGGSGSFSYLVGAMKDANGKEVYSPAVALGDRIEVESLDISDEGVITVTYLDRARGAAMADAPTVAVTKMFGFSKNGTLVQNLK